jgi:hypothetical protein
LATRSPRARGTGRRDPNPSEPLKHPTEADVRSYEERGFWISGDVIPQALLNDAAEAARRWYDGERDAVLPFSDGFSRWKPSDGPDVVRNDEFVSLQSRGIARLALHSVIGEIAARLARTTQIRLLDDQLIYKPAAKDPATTAIGWHADSAYWPTCSSNRLLTAWIPFQDMDDEKGTLMVLDGSHRWSRAGDSRFFKDTDLDGVEARLSREGFAAPRVPLRLRRGQVSFHHGFTLHASLPNRSGAPRLALAVHLQDRDNRYVPRRGRNGERLQIFDEKLCRRLPDGEPDFADPAAFPAIWPAEP